MINHQTTFQPRRLPPCTPHFRRSLNLGASLVLGAWCLVLPLHAQYSIDWFKIAGGGGTSANAQYVVNGTIGQPDTGGTISGGNFSLTGGFWSLLSVVQTPGSPFLSLALTATNTAIISWPFPSTGFALEEIFSLDTTNWISVTNPVQTDGAVKWVIVPANTGNMFFRLKK